MESPAQFSHASCQELLSFGDQDARIVFAGEIFTNRLTARVKQQSFVALNGQSGIEVPPRSWPTLFPSYSGTEAGLLPFSLAITREVDVRMKVLVDGRSTSNPRNGSSSIVRPNVLQGAGLACEIHQ